MPEINLVLQRQLDRLETAIWDQCYMDIGLQEPDANRIARSVREQIERFIKYEITYKLGDENA